MRVLITGWFSFEDMGTTAGDVLVRDVAASWLERAGIPYDIATLAPFGEGVDWRTVDAGAYSAVIFVCGPFGNGPPLVEFLEKFGDCRFFGFNLSMLESLDKWNPFELLLERDSDRVVRPDLSLLHSRKPRPCVGLILIEQQPEYGDRDRHKMANSALSETLAKQALVPIPIDTSLLYNAGGLSTPDQIESLISRMDFVATTRLHGLVLAIKSGVPAVAVDPVFGGAKVSKQASVLGWPAIVTADELSEQRLVELFTYCQTVEARDRARECFDRAIQELSSLETTFLAALS